MPQCHYVILDYYQSDLSSEGLPFMLLVNIDQEETNRNLLVFVAPNFRDVLNGMPQTRREWLQEVLSDFVRHGKSSDSTRGIYFHQFHNLGVGLIRTSISGSINVEKDQNLLTVIESEIQGLYPGSENEHKMCFLDLLQEIQVGRFSDETLNLAGLEARM
jgi:hypothetical protein